MGKIFVRQRQEDYFSVRFKSIGGNFTVAQLATVQAVAEKFGSGEIHFTSRQEISVPFIHAENLPAVEEIISSGKVQASTLGKTFKTVTACQGSGICLSGLIDTLKIAGEIEKRYGGKNFRRKIRIGVTGCRNNCMKVENNDIGVKGGVEPKHNPARCIHCGGCAKICPAQAIEVNRAEKIWRLDEKRCTKCGRCVKRCPAAISGEAGFLIYIGGAKFLPLIRDEEILLQIIDIAIKSFDEGKNFDKEFREVWNG